MPNHDIVAIFVQLLERYRGFGVVDARSLSCPHDGVSQRMRVIALVTERARFTVVAGPGRSRSFNAWSFSKTSGVFGLMTSSDLIASIAGLIKSASIDGVLAT